MSLPSPIQFHTDTPLAEGLRELFLQLEQRLLLRQPLNVYLAGGMAVHLYTAGRVTLDVDAEFSARVAIPADLAVEISLENGQPQVVYFDTNYNSTFALMHEDYINDSLPVDLSIPNINVHVLSPVDLAVSKIARLSDNDRQDIHALVQIGLTTADEIEQRAEEAIGGFVGGLPLLRANLRDALVIAHDAQALMRNNDTSGFEM